MITPFKITFRKKIESISNDIILNNFKVNFKRSKCDNINIINNNQLIVQNKFFILNFRGISNLWIGVGKAYISIKNEIGKNQNEIQYKIDFTRYSIYLITMFSLFIFYFPDLISLEDEDLTIFAFFISYLVFSTISFIIMIVRHRSIFIRTINHGSEYLGNYNWETILKKKTLKELNDIINGRTHLPPGAIRLAKKELENRN